MCVYLSCPEGFLCCWTALVPSPGHTNHRLAPSMPFWIYWNVKIILKMIAKRSWYKTHGEQFLYFGVVC